MIESNYPVATFADILSSVDRTIMLSDIEEYDCIGVRLYGQGAFVRETLPGLSIRRKKQSRIHAGDIIYNKLFAWKGAFCTADQSVDGCIASDKFPIYALKHDRICPEYLALWFQSDELALEARGLSKGAAALSKLTLNPPDFWRMPIPLPDADEQGKVVRKLHSLLSTLAGFFAARAPVDALLQGRRAGIGSEMRFVMSAALDRLAKTFSGRLGILDDVLTMRPRSGPSFPCSEEGIGISVIMPSATLGYRFDERKCLYANEVQAVSDKDIVNGDDILITRGNYRDQVGVCVVYDSDEKRTYANLLMRMQVDRRKTLPEFVKYWMMTPIAIEHIRRHTKGTSPSVQKINQKGIISIPFPKDVAVDVQWAWVRFLDRMFGGVEELETAVREQHEVARRLKKAILSTAFRGELTAGGSSARVDRVRDAAD